jgi:polysaccharide biosynthesis transport protein
MNQFEHISLAPYVDIIYRHRVSALCVLMVGVALTIAASFMVPSIYRSTTLVMIQPQEVPSQYVSAPVTGHIRDRLQALSQIALSRTRLEEVITQYDLYHALRSRGTPIERVVDYMRKHIQLDILEDRNNLPDSRTDSFNLSYEYPDASIAQRVTGRLADLLINEDRRRRAVEAAATIAFLDEQLSHARVSLESKGREIKIFKDHHQGSLPQDLEINLKILGDLQTQLQSANETFAALQQRRSQLERDLVRAHEDKVTITSASGERSSASPEAALSLKQTELAELEAQESDQHPDVVRLKAETAALKAMIKHPKGGVAGMSPIELELTKELDQTDVDQRRLQAEIPNLKRQISDYQKRIGETPAHEQQFANLSRDYNVIDDGYHKLLGKKLQAQIAQNLEQHDEGERFQVLDPANFPLSPEAPNRKGLVVGGLVLSLGLAAAVPFALFFTDSSFKDPDELRQVLGLSIAATIPALDEIENLQPARKTLYQSATLSSACFSLGLIALWLYARTF